MNFLAPDDSSSLLFSSSALLMYGIILIVVKKAANMKNSSKARCELERMVKGILEMLSTLIHGFTVAVTPALMQSDKQRIQIQARARIPSMTISSFAGLPSYLYSLFAVRELKDEVIVNSFARFAPLEAEF